MAGGHLLQWSHLPLQVAARFLWDQVRLARQPYQPKSSSLYEAVGQSLWVACEPDGEIEAVQELDGLRLDKAAWERVQLHPFDLFRWGGYLKNEALRKSNVALLQLLLRPWGQQEKGCQVLWETGWI